MAFFPRSFVNEPTTFGPLFRLLEDFESHNQAATKAHSHKLISPKFDIKELPENYELHGEFPGMEQKNITLEFTDPQTLTVRARQEYEYQSSDPSTIEEPKASGAITGAESSSSHSHQPSVEDENEGSSTSQTQVQKHQPAQVEKVQQPHAQYHVHERSVGEFYRQFSFPGRIDQDAVSASMRNGILSVIVPKAKKHESRKIAIN